VGINQTLLREIRPFIYKYDCEERDVERILDPPNLFERQLYPRHFLKDRRAGVVDSISSIMEPHGKRHLFEHVSQLRRVEDGMHSMVPYHRDHVLHALLCFLLGIYINEKFIPEFQTERVDPFQWEIAALFHDIGYPIEMAYRAIIGPYFGALKEYAIARQPLPSGICELSKGQNSLELIQRQLDKWNLTINAGAQFQDMLRPRSVNHGMVSAITTLKRIDSFYQEKNPSGEYNQILSEDGVDWNQKYFEQDILPACSAMFVHGLDRACFEKSKIKLSKAPLVFLLKLSDSLQEWDRSLNRRQNFPSTLFDIEVKHNRLIFSAQIPDRVKTRMWSEIADCLEDPQVEIR